MKKITMFIALLFISITISIVSCGKSRSGNWAVKIDSDGITIEEFKNYYYSFLKMPLSQVKMDISNEDIDNFSKNPAMQRQLPLLNKKIFMEQLIGMKILNEQAEEDSSINKDELDALVEYSKLQTVAMYYIKHHFKGKIEVSDKEIEKIYYDRRFGFYKMPLQDAEMRIRTSLQQQKLMQMQNQLISDLVQKHKVDKSGFESFLTGLEKAEAAKAEKEAEKAKEAEKPEKAQK